MEFTGHKRTPFQIKLDTFHALQQSRSTPKCNGYTSPEAPSVGLVLPEHPLSLSAFSASERVDHSGNGAHLTGARP